MATFELKQFPPLSFFVPGFEVVPGFVAPEFVVVDAPEIGVVPALVDPVLVVVDPVLVVVEPVLLDVGLVVDVDVGLVVDVVVVVDVDVVDDVVVDLAVVVGLV